MTSEVTETTDSPVTGRRRAVHTRTTVLGLLLAAGALVFLLAVELVRGPSFEAFFMIPLAVITAVVAGLAWRFGTWSKVFAAVTGLVLLLILGPVFVSGLATPENFSMFVGGAAYLVGALIAVVGAIAAVVKRRETSAEATFIERQVRTVSLAVIGLVAAFSAIVSVTGQAGIDDETRAIATEVLVQNYEFDDGTVEVAAGEPTTLIVTNRDWSMHTFTVGELGVDVAVRPGREVVVELPALDAGTYRINCRPHSGHEARLVAR